MTVVWVEFLMVFGSVIIVMLIVQKYLRRKTGSKWDVLLLKKKIKFNYVPQSTEPDLIQVILDGKVIYMYFWINGEQAHEDTKLGQLHKRYTESVNGSI